MHSDQMPLRRVSRYHVVQRRRRWPTANRLVEETKQPGMSVPTWSGERRRSRAAVQPASTRCWKAACKRSRPTKSRGTSRVRERNDGREPERLLGRKTMEVETLKEALDVARVKKPAGSCHHGTIGGRFAMRRGPTRRGRPFEPDRAGQPPRQVA